MTDVAASADGAPGRASDAGRYAVGIVHYQSYDDLEACLASVAALRPAPGAVLVLDVEPSPERAAGCRARHPDVAWEEAPNRGYAGGANRALRRLAELAPAADFDLLLNPDVVLAPDHVAALLEALDGRADVALASGKLMRPDGEHIDSAGIVLPAHRRPRDRGSEERDRGQFDRTEYVFGASGAALFVRRAAAADLALDGEVFDEDFFLYHEETDLAWRARRLGWRVLYVPGARAVHGRRWRREARFEVPASIRRHSFKNHYLQLIKNERAHDFWLRLPVLALWEGLRLGYALLRDRAVLPAYGEAWRLAGRAWRKRKRIQERARQRALRSDPSAPAG